MRAEATSHRSSSPTRQLSRFRERRGRRLARLIDRLAAHRDRPLTILDLGGSRDYWGNVPITSRADIIILNKYAFEFVDTNKRQQTNLTFENLAGDATRLDAFADQSVDLVHSNSVIEHVGGWAQIKAFATEAKRVGRGGWIQTPAFEFPIDSHSKLPFFHWFGQPIRAGALRLRKKYRASDVDRQRSHVDYVTHLSYGEMKYLFSGRQLFIERFLLLPKSYVAHWDDTEAAH